MIRLVRRFGLRRGIVVWRLQRAWRAERALFEWRADNVPEFRTHHGERPRLTGYRRNDR